MKRLFFGRHMEICKTCISSLSLQEKSCLVLEIWRAEFAHHYVQDTHHTCVLHILGMRLYQNLSSLKFHMHMALVVMSISVNLVAQRRHHNDE